MKRFFDLLLAVPAGIVLAVPGICIAMAVRLTSPGPILYWSNRVGAFNKIFRMPKFRTMRVGTPAVATHLLTNPEAHLTPIGGFLRTTSLDELPQLWNVLRGEMSLVGPRPLPVDEIRRINDPAHRRRLSVKPGLTCLWQISGRNEVSSFKEWVRLDLEYIDNWSFWLDLKILLKTIPVVLTGAGAK